MGVNVRVAKIKIIRERRGVRESAAKRCGDGVVSSKTAITAVKGMEQSAVKGMEGIRSMRSKGDEALNSK